MEIASDHDTPAIRLTDRRMPRLPAFVLHVAEVALSKQVSEEIAGKSTCSALGALTTPVFVSHACPLPSPIKHCLFCTQNELAEGVLYLTKVLLHCFRLRLLV